MDVGLEGFSGNGQQRAGTRQLNAACHQLDFMSIAFMDVDHVALLKDRLIEVRQKGCVAIKSLIVLFAPGRVGVLSADDGLPLNEQGPQRLRSVPLYDNLHLENSFEDNGVTGQRVLDLLALEDDVFQRCPASTALQRSNRGKCAHLLSGFAATADLPPHCPLFALQLLDLTHRWWSETEGPDIEEGDAYSLAAAAYVYIKLHYAGYLARLHISFRTLGSRSFSQGLLPLFWAGANLATCRLCTRLRLCMKLRPSNTAPRSQVNYELATSTPPDLVCLFETRFSFSVEHLRQRGDWLTTLAGRALSFRGSCKLGPVSCQ